MELKDIIAKVVAGKSGDEEKSAFSSIISSRSQAIVAQGKEYITRNLFGSVAAKE